jgi:AcrR family transcriptional regulator
MTPRYRDDNRRQAMSETRQRLIIAAEEEIAREGYENASISRITQAAGVATGTIYNYFPSKHELMLAILTEIGTAHCASIVARIRQEEDVLRRAEMLMEVVFAYVGENPMQGRIIFTMLQGSNLKFKTHMSQVYLPMSRLISEEILIPGMEKGVFPTMDPESTTLMIMTFFLGLGAIVDENGGLPLDLTEVGAFVLRALGAQPTGKEQ